MNIKFEIEVTHHIDAGTAAIIRSIVDGLASKHDLIRMEKRIMATQAELAAELNTVSANVAKIGTETSLLLQKVADLEAAIAAGGPTTPEVDAALAALKAQVTVVDDLVPDAA